MAVAVGRARVACGGEDRLALGSGLGEEALLGAQECRVAIRLAFPPACRDDLIGVGIHDGRIDVQDSARV